MLTICFPTKIRKEFFWYTKRKRGKQEAEDQIRGQNGCVYTFFKKQPCLKWELNYERKRKKEGKLAT